MRVDIYLKNLGESNIAVGMTTIKPRETKKILPKDFERKASYIDRMIKERKLSFGSQESVNTSALVENSEDDTPNKGIVNDDETTLGKDKDTDLKSLEDISDKPDASGEKKDDNVQEDELVILEEIVSPKNKKQ